MKIKAIYGQEPMREREFQDCFCVGENGVTEIRNRDENYGDHGLGWYDVFKGEFLAMSMSARHVSLILYFENEP